MKIADDIFKCIINESVWISITISLKFVPKGPRDCKSALVQVMEGVGVGVGGGGGGGGGKITKLGDFFSLGFSTSCSVCFTSLEFI